MANVGTSLHGRIQDQDDAPPGRRTVNTEPLPGSLSTVMSPPIIWAKTLADGKAKAGAAVLARRLRGRLRELLEQLVHLFGRHANAGVGDGERDPVAAVLLSLVSARQGRKPIKSR